MKNVNILIALILIILLILNVDSVLPSNTKTVAIDPTIAIIGEGMVAMAIHDMKFDIDVIVPTEECKCNGTKMIRSGDGLIDVPCPCGTSCVCKKQEQSNICNCGCGKEGCQCGMPSLSKVKGAITGYVQGPVIETIIPIIEKPEIKILPVQIIQFTARWCPPCHAFNEDKNGGKELEAKNWYKNGLIKRIDIEEYPELFEKYKQDDAIPQFVVIKNGKVVDYIVGRPMTDKNQTAANKISSLYMKYYEQK